MIKVSNPYSGLTINKESEAGSGDASPNPSQPNGREIHLGQSSKNNLPTKGVIGFFHINLNNHPRGVTMILV